jgi:hypothetical protein
MQRYASLLLVCIVSAACSGSGDGPTAPTGAVRSAGGIFEGVISATEAPCASARQFGDHQNKPCHRYGPFVVPERARVAIELSWQVPAPNDLEFEVWINGLPATASHNEFGNSDQMYSPTSCGPGVTCPPNEPPGTYEVRVVYLGPGTRWYHLRVSWTW